MTQESTSADRPLILTGTFRVYFNRHGAAPLVWCIATGEIENAVANIVIEAPSVTRYKPKATPDDEDGKPSAWFEVRGTLTIQPGFAVVHIGPSARAE